MLEDREKEYAEVKDSCEKLLTLMAKHDGVTLKTFLKVKESLNKLVMLLELDDKLRGKL